MSDPILAAFVIIVVGLFSLAGLTAAYQGIRARSAGACLCLAGAGALLALLDLVVPVPAVSTSLPFGPPGQSMHVALDPVAACLLGLLFVAGIAVAALEIGGKPAEATSALPVCLGGLALAVLAADAFTLAVGVALAGTAAGAASINDRQGVRRIGVLLMAASGLFVAVAILAPATENGGLFSAIRAVPPEAMHAAAAFLVAFLAIAPLAGFVPLHGVLATTPVGGSLLAAAVGPIALGLLMRIGLELVGPAPPLWWALPPLGLGAAVSVLAAWRAAGAAELDSIVTASCLGQRGLASIAFATALLAKAADLPELASLAAAAMLLLLLTQALCAPLAIITAGFVQTAAGSRRLDRLGGLIHFMPMTAMALAASLFTMTALPPAAGFASFYLLFETVLAEPRGAGLLPSLVCAALVLVLSLTSALGVTAMVRSVGVACLGRPRTPRAAGARELPRRTRSILAALGCLSILLGLLPGLALWIWADPALAGLTGAALGSRAGVLHIAPSADTTGYAPLPLAALLAAVGGGLLWAQRRRPRPSGEPVPAWQDGFAPPPAWMPFGDPLTQSTGAGFLPPLPVVMRPPALPALRLPALRLSSLRRRLQAPLVLLVIFAAALTVLACVGAA